MDTIVQPLQWSDLAVLAPELTLVLAAIIITLLDLFVPKKWNREWSGVLSLLSLGAALGFVIWTIVDRIALVQQGGTLETIQLLNHSYRVDDFALWIKVLLLIGAALIVLMSLKAPANANLGHRSEYYYLLLPAVLGAMMLASAGDLITLFIGLELLSITTYILVGIKKDSQGLEGAFKYLVLGGAASAFILYGMSFLYGMSGSTNLMEIGKMLNLHAAAYEPLIYVSFVLLFVGIGFKIASAPFHMWAPEVYEASPSPIASFLAVIAKAASLVLLFRLAFNVFLRLTAASDQASDQLLFLYQDLSTIMLVLAAVSMIVGTTMALREHRVKRVLALSGIANTGYLLVPIALNMLGAGTPYSDSFASFWYYLAAYLFAVIGAFAVWIIVERQSSMREQSTFAGLYHRSPWLALAMTVFMLSLAGIPITAGFVGKLYILLGALATKALWIAVVMMLTSAVSFYVYFGFIRQMYMRQGERDKVGFAFPQQAVVVLCLAGVIGLGLIPNLPLNWIHLVFSVPADIFTQ